MLEGSSVLLGIFRLLFMFLLIFFRSFELVEVEDNEFGILVVSFSILRLRDILKVMFKINSISMYNSKICMFV